MTITTYQFTNDPTPAYGGDYTDGTYYASVTLTAPVRMEDQPGCLQAWSKAWLRNADGTPVKDANGNPIRTRSVPHTINLSQLETKQATKNPGWIVYRGTTPDPANLPAGWTSGTALPSTGKVGDYFYDSTDGTFWQWDMGILYTIHTGRLVELVSLAKSHGVTF